MIIFTLNATYFVRKSKSAFHYAKRSPFPYFIDSLVWLEVKTGSAIVNRQKHESFVLKNTLNLLPQEDILNARTLGGTMWLPELPSIKVVKFVCFYWRVKGHVALLLALYIKMNTRKPWFLF